MNDGGGDMSSGTRPSGPKGLNTLKDTELFLLDMDGTIYLGDELIEGSLSFLEALSEAGKRYVFFTNNSSWNVDHYLNKLRGFGISVERENIISSTLAAIDYVKRESASLRVYPLGTPQFEEEIRTGGLIIDDADPDFVVLAFDRTLTYEKLQRAHEFLQNGVRYIAVNPDLVCPTPAGSIPDCGSMIALLEASTGRIPEAVMGKPEPYMINIARDRFGIDLDSAAIVGDRMYTDMEMGKRAGIKRILVFSGETKRDAQWGGSC